MGHGRIWRGRSWGEWTTTELFTSSAECAYLEINGNHACNALSTALWYYCTAGWDPMLPFPNHFNTVHLLNFVTVDRPIFRTPSRLARAYHKEIFTWRPSMECMYYSLNVAMYFSLWDFLMSSHLWTRSDQGRMWPPGRTCAIPTRPRHTKSSDCSCIYQLIRMLHEFKGITLDFVKIKWCS